MHEIILNSNNEYLKDSIHNEVTKNMQDVVLSTENTLIEAQKTQDSSNSLVEISNKLIKALQELK